MNYWLIKSDPDIYTIDQLQKDGQSLWKKSVRNYQARNFLREMQPDDLAFFYYSQVSPPGIAGVMKIVESGIDDPNQFDPTSQYFDPKSTPESPRWQTVKVQYVETFPELLTLKTIKQHFSADELWVVRRGNRLSVMPVPETIGEQILQLGR